MLDYKLITNVEVDGIGNYMLEGKFIAGYFNGVGTTDYPDFCDAFISYAEYNGEPMTKDQLDELNDDGEFIQEAAMDYLH